VGVADERGTPAQAPDPEQDLLGQPFRLDSISEVPAPDGAEGVWHRYVIVQGSNTINGMRPGELSDVRVQIDDIVRRLNERFLKAQTGSPSRSSRRPPPPRGSSRTPDFKSTTAVAAAPARVPHKV
jgi:hypothetical protein